MINFTESILFEASSPQSQHLSFPFGSRFQTLRIREKKGFRHEIPTFHAAGGSLSTKPDTGIQPGTTVFFSTTHSHANNSNELQSKGKDNMYSQVKQKTD